jgi:hypothetical protein
MSTEITGPAASTRATLTGTRMTAVQVSKAEEIAFRSRTASSSSVTVRSAGPASTGTTIAVSAPPSTMS